MLAEAEIEAVFRTIDLVTKPERCDHTPESAVQGRRTDRVILYIGSSTSLFPPLVDQASYLWPDKRPHSRMNEASLPNLADRTSRIRFSLADLFPTV